MQRVTGLANPNSQQQLDPWLRDKHGVVMPNYQAETIEATIKLAAIPQEALYVLNLKRRISMTAPAKWSKYLDMVCPDSTLKGMYVYGGAGRTRRWASRGVNLQNLKRPPFDDMEAAVWFIKNATLDQIESIYGDPLEFLASTVRGGITAPAGTTIGVSDLGSIESRVVGWISGCRFINNTFAHGLDTYKMMAVDIYHVQYDEVTKKQRTFSKPVVLAGPYGQGANGLVAYAEQYGVMLTESEAKTHVDAFRSRCYEITNMWKWLEGAVQDVVLNGSMHTGYKVKIYLEKDFLFIELPSTRRLAYFKPKIQMKRTPWGKIKPTFTYMGKHKDKDLWVELKAHAGLLVENIVQAIARDVLVNGLLWAAHKGLDIRGHVHDEIISILPEQTKQQGLDLLKWCMCQRPQWADGLMLAADGFTTHNYRKD